ncbi:hypothetical protein EDD22DRAFT_1001461, partial [Suillus occidentalis]
ALYNLADALRSRFAQRGSIDNIDESVHLRRVAVSLRPEGHTGHSGVLNISAISLKVRFHHQGTPHVLDDAIVLHEVLRMRSVGHKFQAGLVIHFSKRGDIDGVTRAMSLYREAPTLRPPGHPRRNATLNNLASTLKTRHEKLHVSEKVLNEAIHWYRECLQLVRLDHLERHKALFNLSSVLCSRFTHLENEDVEETINLWQETLGALPSLHSDSYFSYMRLQEAYLSH